MRAVTLDYRDRRLLQRHVPEPPPPGPGQVLLQVKEAGVCGTDRELAAFHFGFPPDGDHFLILGHEALAQVIDSGAPDAFSRGDWVVPMIRRACHPACASCARGRRDLCLSGKAPERGIFGAHGYFAEYALDEAADLVRIPPSLIDHAVLLEPLSVVEKAAAEAFRLHAGEPRTALVLGAGAIGLLAALVLQLRGLDVAVTSAEPAAHPRARLVRDAGLRYVDICATPSPADIVMEATGSPEAALKAVRALAPLGVAMILGAAEMPPGLSLIDLIAGNRIIAGSVNAGPEAFRNGVADLAAFDPRILHRLVLRVPFDAFGQSILGPPGAAAKIVHVLQD